MEIVVYVNNRLRGMKQREDMKYYVDGSNVKTNSGNNLRGIMKTHMDQKIRQMIRTPNIKRRYRRELLPIVEFLELIRFQMVAR